jgi:RNA-binding protein
MHLTGKQKRMLRGMGHALEPIVYIGKNGIEQPQVMAVEQALLDHELIKVKLGKGAPYDLKEMVRILETEGRGTCVQTIGKVALFYAPHPEEPVIKLPKTEPDEQNSDMPLAEDERQED